LEVWGRNHCTMVGGITAGCCKPWAVHQQAQTTGKGLFFPLGGSLRGCLGLGL
jgi:hypothetical protein